MYEDKRVDTKRETDQKCPSCGGTMDFNPKTEVLHVRIAVIREKYLLKKLKTEK
jgi:hypothetical protein